MLLGCAVKINYRCVNHTSDEAIHFTFLLQVKENSINLIFAVTAEQRETYNELSRHIEASSAGTLSNDSSNVVQLVKEQYEVSDVLARALYR